MNMGSVRSGTLSFLFILIGGPLVESTHNDLKFTAPLTAITAAVVGVDPQPGAVLCVSCVVAEGL